MPSLRAAVMVVLAATTSALPTSTRLTDRQLRYHEISRRQNDAAAALGLNDFDILQFALTLENLEETYYREGFAKFPDSDFAALGLSDTTLASIKQIGATEAQHVTFLQSALAQSGVAPVQPCEYDFSALAPDAATMISSAAVLESIGISAYLGAAPLLADPALLGAAGSILTIEARHQSSIRVFSTQEAVPQAFDAPLGPKAVFSLAAPFIKSCPDGSNLILTAFPALTMDAAEASAAAIGGTLKPLAADGASGATHCAFTSGGVVPGGTKFTPFTESDGCAVPDGVAGVTYLSLASSGPIEGTLTDDITVAGPMVLTLS